MRKANISPALLDRVRQSAQMKSEFRVETDPSFVHFSKEVQSVAVRLCESPIKPYKLVGLWFKSKVFSEHWYNGGGDSSRHMAWICFHFGLSMVEATSVVLAWVQYRHRYPNEDQIMCEVGEMIAKVYEDVQPSLKQQRDRKNEKKRFKRRAKPNRRPQGRPRDLSPDSLRNRIIETLKEGGRMTAPMIVNALQGNLNSVSSWLRRLLLEGVVRKPGRGLYELVNPRPVAKQSSAVVPASRASTSRPAERTKHNPTATFTSSSFLTADDIEEEIAYHRAPVSYEAYTLPSLDAPELSSFQREMPTAEPKWMKRYR